MKRREKLKKGTPIASNKMRWRNKRNRGQHFNGENCNENEQHRPTPTCTTTTATISRRGPLEVVKSGRVKSKRVVNTVRTAGEPHSAETNDLSYTVAGYDGDPLPAPIQRKYGPKGSSNIVSEEAADEEYYDENVYDINSLVDHSAGDSDCEEWDFSVESYEEEKEEEEEEDAVFNEVLSRENALQR